MHRAHLIGTLLLAAPAFAGAAAAQVELGFNYSRNDALPGAPHLGGLSFGSYAGPIGVRLNGGINLFQRDPADAYRTSTTHVGAWTADADLVFAPFRASREARLILLGFSPFAFVGIGGQGSRLPGIPDTTFATWSYGAGVSHQLAGPIGIMADARYREPLERHGPAPSAFADEWEYRVGMTISFGAGGHSRRATRARSHPTHGRVRETDEQERVTRPARATRHMGGGALVDDAERYLGTRYRYGGDSPSDGFDCSGFVQYVYGRKGIALPRVSRAMAGVGEALEPRVSDVTAGDLLFFANDGSHIDHVAIYAGGNRILHATASGGGVRYDDLDSPRGRWFAERLVAARRVTGIGDDLSSSRRYRSVDDTEFDPPDRAPVPR